MGFAKAVYTPSRPRKYELAYAALPDEQAVRGVIQRQYHRPQSESWADSSCRIAAMNKKQIRQELEAGLITPGQARRRRCCTPPSARLHKEDRRVCRHHGCPWCRYRTLLATFRALHHNVVQPEQQARFRKGRARTGMRNRLVLCQVKFTTPKNVSIQSTLDTIIREQLVRKIQRAGGIRDGLATTSISDLRSKNVITVSVLGISQKAVQHLHPDVCASLHPRSAVTRLIPPRASVSAGIAICNALPDISVETVWKAAVRGHDCPVFGPASLFRLLAATMPRTRDATGIRLKRFQPLGAWKQFLRRRMPMPRPIFYPCRRSQDAKHPLHAATERVHKAAIRNLVRHTLGKLGLGEDRQLADMAIGWNINKCFASMACQRLLAGLAFERLGFPRQVAPVNLGSLWDPLLGVDGYLPPPERGGLEWERITSAVCRDKATWIILSPGKARELAAIHADTDAAALGGARRIGGTGYFIQPFDRFLDYCWTQWKLRPVDKTGLFKDAV